MRLNGNRRWFVVGAVVLLLVLLLGISVALRPTPAQVDLTKMIADIRSGQVTEITLSADGRMAELTNADKSTSHVTIPAGDTLNSLLKDAQVPFEQWPPVKVGGGPGLSEDVTIFMRILAVIGFGGVLFFIIRRLGPGMMGGANTRRSSFEQVKPTQRAVTFADVAGSEEVKEEVSDIVDFLRDPDRFRSVGAHIPRGLLLVGPPGTGKTLLARALAGEARASFFSVSGSEFVELYVGVGASRVRELFRKAKASAPAIIFVDEIDAIGRRRGRMEQSSEYDQTLNQILVEMDGFEERTTVIVVAATNRVDILDPALLRPGRFDRKVMVDAPDRAARQAILEVHSRGKPIGSDVVLDEIAARTTGMTGADLANVINEAAILAARDRRPAISMADMAEALDRTMAGPARKGRRFTERERKVVAYHEAGHAVVAHLLPHADTVRKVSIISRGQAGGFTMIVPDEDRGLWTHAQLHDRLAALLGGLAAEETVFNEITTGSSNDLEQVTAIATSMVQRYGMSQEFGLLSIGNAAGDMSQLSPQRAFAAEQEAKELVDSAHRTALDVLRAHRDDLERVAQRLLEVETIDGEEMEELTGPLREIPVRRRAHRPTPQVLEPVPVEPERRPGRTRRTGRAVAAVAAFARGALANALKEPRATDVKLSGRSWSPTWDSPLREARGAEPDRS
ncbi:ATP-dependent zinc metalloprotease FtsH [Nitrolancea hollandica]|uniref:ATP-dependent zinc metalloprotease FtsH n=1 Tax=Nitrolancea hollandica TaxID=1206749 RepID=UPI000684B9B4|nr:ATP-dependent zinc metalloprotease FtsH [Nitrolancea hollandica]